MLMVGRLDLGQFSQFNRGMVYVNPMVYFLTNGDSEIVRFNVTDLYLEFKFAFKGVVDFQITSTNDALYLITKDFSLTRAGIRRLPQLEHISTLNFKDKDLYHMQHLTSLQVVEYTVQKELHHTQVVVAGWNGLDKNTFILISNVLSVMDSIEVQSSSSTPRLTQTLLFT